MKNLDEIKRILLENKKDLSEHYFVNKLGLFGSVVRNDLTEESDIDIIVDFYRSVGVEFIELADKLEKLLGNKVDLVSMDGIKERYFKEIEQEIVYV